VNGKIGGGPENGVPAGIIDERIKREERDWFKKIYIPRRTTGKDVQMR